MREMKTITRGYVETIQKIGGREGLNFIAEMNPTISDQVTTQKNTQLLSELPLLGMPIFIKDNIDVCGLHTTAGSLALEDNVATKDAPVVAALKRQGGVIVGKTNMTEFANYTSNRMPGGYSSRGGQVINAINPDSSPSGSSSGSAVAVSSGVVDVAIGTDTCFSVVHCAEENGVCGLKPPVGTFSSEGIIPISKTLDSPGIIANKLRNVLWVYGAMREDDIGKKIMTLEAAEVSGLKIAINTANQDMVSEGQKLFLSKILSEIEILGGQISRISQLSIEQVPIIMKYEFMAHLEEYLENSTAKKKTLREIVDYYEAHPDTMERYGIPLLKGALCETGEGLKDKIYLKAMEDRTQIKKNMIEKLKDLDAVIMTGPTQIMHLCGLPSLSIVSDTIRQDGIRRGLILYGTDEIRLYRAALALEKLCRNT